MNDAEKARLEDILNGSDAIVEEDDVMDGQESVAFTVQTNKTGFAPDRAEISLLESIDEKLRKLIPTQDWEAKSIIFAPTAEDTGSVASHSNAAAPLSRGASAWWSAVQCPRSGATKGFSFASSSCKGFSASDIAHQT